MTALRAALAVPIDRAERYRAEGLWGGRKLADGIEAAAGRRSRALALADNDSRFTYEEGWYRTGDLVEMNGGRLTVIGRLEDVVNRSGLEISLAEIDSALAGLRGAREHACFAVPDPETGEHLAVAVLPEEGATVTLDDVARHLLARGLARRKLPEQLVLWDGPLPRTASGKVVRSRLRMESPAKPSQCVERLREEPGCR